VGRTDERSDPRYLEEVFRAGSDPVAARVLAEQTVDVLALRYRVNDDKGRPGSRTGSKVISRTA